MGGEALLLSPALWKEGSLVLRSRPPGSFIHPSSFQTDPVRGMHLKRRRQMETEKERVCAAEIKSMMVQLKIFTREI